MSWHYLQGQEAASWEGNSLAGAPSALLSLIPTAGGCSSQGSATATSRDSRYGTTCEPSTARRGADTSTLSAVGSPVRTSASPVPARGSTENEAGYGWSLLASLARYDHDSRSWKTPQCSLLGDSEGFSETWPRWGSMRDGVCWEQSTPGLGTKGTESGSWPTLCTVDTGSLFNRSASKGAALRPTLGAMARFGLWPTLTVHGNYNRKGASPNSGDGLATVIGGPLNPTWCEWFMGWPIGWTALEPLATDKYQQWLDSHGRR